jgi:hypothetical protein
MPAEDFDRWNAENHGLSGATAEKAREAWLAAEECLLRPEGQTLPKVIALAVLRGDHAQLGVLADWLADQGRLDPLVRERLDDLRRGFRVRFEQGFRCGPGGGHRGYAVRDVCLPFSPFTGLYVHFAAEGLFSQVDSVFWDVKAETFLCILTEDPKTWDSPDQAVASYGDGWLLGRMGRGSKG